MAFQKNHVKRSDWVLVPSAGAILFLLLYILAAVYYPGGSQADAHSKGFSWMHNYWCNLLNEKGINGEVNTGRAIAIAAMVVLTLSLLFFWIVSARLLFSKKASRTTITLAGLICVCVLAFLATSYHDTVINVSGFFGLVAMAGCFAGITRKRWYRLLTYGLFNVVLVGLNNYLYYSNHWFYLPLIQKLTFLSFLIWIVLVDIKLYKEAINEKSLH